MPSPTTHIITKAVLGRELRKGDVITHIDNRATPAFLVTATVRPGEPIEVEQPGRVPGVQVRIYPDTNVDSSVTVRRAHRQARRRFGPLSLVNTGERYWESEPPRFVVEFCAQGWTECENPHPLRDGGYCPGGEPHEWFGWQAWDTDADDYVVRSADSFTEAATDVAGYLADGRRRS